MKYVILSVILLIGRGGVANHITKLDSALAPSLSVHTDISRTQELVEESEKLFSISQAIISWSGFILTFFSLILVVAGYVGFREFSRVRTLKKELDENNKNIQTLIKEISDYKERTTADLKAFQDNIYKNAESYLKITHLLNQGIILYNSGNYSEAIDLFNSILDFKPNDYDANCYLSRAYMGVENYPLSLSVIETAIKINPDHYFAYFVKGEILRRKQQYLESIESFEKSLEFNTRERKVFISLAYAQFRNKRFLDAEVNFRTALKLRRNASGACGLGKIYILLNKKEKALEYFHDAVVLAKEDIELKPKYAYPYYEAAFSYLALNSEKNCLLNLRKACLFNNSKSITNEQLIDFNMFLGKEIINQDLLKRCVNILKKNT